MRRLSQLVLAAVMSVIVAGCGTFTPPLVDFPDPSAATKNAAEARLIADVARAVRCQLGASITETIQNDWRLAEDRPNKRRYSDAFDNWGAEVAITITITDKGGIAPSVLATPPSPATAVFTLAAGLGVTSESYRSVKFNTFYTVRQLFDRPCSVAAHQGASPLVASDLRITPLLEGRLLAIRVAAASPLDEPGRTNVLSNTIRFTVNTSADLNPAWKLVDASVNSGGKLLTASRDRAHDVVITFGPLDRNRGGRSLIFIAEQTHIYAIAQRDLLLRP